MFQLFQTWPEFESIFYNNTCIIIHIQGTHIKSAVNGSLSAFLPALRCYFCLDILFFNTSKASCLHHFQTILGSRVMEAQHVDLDLASIKNSSADPQSLYGQCLDHTRHDHIHYTHMHIECAHNISVLGTHLC